MAPIGQPSGPDEAMEIEADFQDWTLEMDVVNQQYGEAQAAEDSRLKNTITTIENQIQADSDALIANLNGYMQQCLEKMQQEMKGAVSRQVQHHLQLERMKVEHEARKQERSKAKKKQIIDLFDKRRSPPAPRRKETSIVASDRERSVPRQHTISVGSLDTVNGRSPKISNPEPKAYSSLRNSEDDRRPVKTIEAQTPKPSDHFKSATPVLSQENQATPAAASDAPADNISISVRDPSKEPSVDSERVVDPLGIVAAKRKGDIFASSPADTAKRARLEQRKVADEISTTIEASGSQTPQPASSQLPGPAQRTISFDEVFQEGKAEHKHVIVEYMDVSGHFYILKCDEHHVHFGSNPLAGAAKHLSSSQHNKLPKTHELAIEKLGYYVTGCTRALADKNNAHFQEAVKKGYEPFNANRLSKAEKVALGFETTESPSQPQTGMKHKGAKEAELTSGVSGHQFQGITDPVSGELYLGYWAKTKTKYPVIILPLGDLKAAGLNGNLLQTSLQKNIPKCYQVTHPTPGTVAIEGWAKDYEDGGPKVTKREFPVMYFDKRYLVGWITARHLSEFDFEDPNPFAYPGYSAARDYWAKIQDGGCADYEDWKRRGRIRNPTLSPTSSKEASPASGGEKSTGQGTSSTSQATPSHPGSPKAVDGPDGRADEEMADAENIDHGDVSSKSLADTIPEASTELRDVEMDMGNETPSNIVNSANDAKSQEIKSKEQLHNNQDKIAAERTAPSNEYTKPLSLLKGPQQVEKLPVVPSSHILASQKQPEKMPQALSIPTPPLNSTETSPTATVSPLVASSSLQTHSEKQNAQQLATGTLRVQSPKVASNGVNGTPQNQRDTVNKLLQVMGSPKSTIISASERSGVTPPQGTSKSINVTQVNGNSQTALPASPRVRTPAADVIPGRQSAPSPKANSPARNMFNGFKVGLQAPATSIPSTREQPQATSFARNPGLPQKNSRPSSPLTTGISGSAFMQQSRSPTTNGGPREQTRAPGVTTQVPSRPVNTSPITSTYPSFMSAAQRPQPINSARSLSPAFGPYRSASSTPTPASEGASRHSTPTVMRGDSIDRWKAVRSSSYSQPPQTSLSYSTLASRNEAARGQSLPQERRDSGRGFSLSSIMTPSTPGSASSRPSPVEVGREQQYFDAIAYTDATDNKKFVSLENKPFLRVNVDAARGVAETAAGEAVAVTIDPRGVSNVVVRNAGPDVVSVTVTLRRPDSRPEYWAFGTKKISGREVSGKIQARSFCKWIMSVNPNVEYMNPGPVTIAEARSRQSS